MRLVDRLRKRSEWSDEKSRFGEADDMRDAAAEIERLQAIEQSARELLIAVELTHDHTQWFKPLAALRAKTPR